MVEIAIDGQWSEVEEGSLSRPPRLDRPLTACVRFLNGKVFDFRHRLVSQLHARLAPLMRTLKPDLDCIQSVACGVKEPAAEQPALHSHVHRESPSQLQALRETLHAMAITNRRLPRAPFETLRIAKREPMFT